MVNVNMTMMSLRCQAAGEKQQINRFVPWDGGNIYGGVTTGDGTWGDMDVMIRDVMTIVQTFCFHHRQGLDVQSVPHLVERATMLDDR